MPLAYDPTSGKLVYDPTTGKLALDCNPQYVYVLQHCNDQEHPARCAGDQPNVYTLSDLSQHLNKAIRWQDICWLVSRQTTPNPPYTSVTPSAVYDSCASCCPTSSFSHCCGCQTVSASFSNKTILSLNEPGVDGTELDHLLAGFMLDTRGHFPPDQTGTGWCMWDFTGDQDDRPLLELVHEYQPWIPYGLAFFACETWSDNNYNTWELWTSEPVEVDWAGPDCWPLEFTVTMRLGNAAITFDVTLDCADV